MNRRGNGLSADSYAPLVDLAPHLADAVLAALRDAGVAAYAVPGEPGDPATVLDEGPAAADDTLDRLFVDDAMKPQAEGVLRVHLLRLRESGAGDAEPLPPHPGRTPETAPAEPPAAARDEDAIWAEIVAGFDAAPAAGERVPWPDSESLPEPKEPPAEGDDRTGALPRARVIKPAEDDADGPLEEDDDAHFVPPPPPPMPSTDPVTKGAWAALVGGPLYLLCTVLLDWYVPGWAAFLAVAAFIGGFVTLVLRMGDEPRDPDGGAAV
ncbi:hypothetical protein [Actinomadura flavalba]|uniref:hypothetical protein n=1 Tax=Actinomadura flavalba TaxID=1120938 RepID=UPI0003609587|nr:hypothetical protein [Actinomadura flavalba]